MSWRQVAFWSTGVMLLVASIFAPGAAPNVGAAWILVQAGLSLGLVAVHVWLRRPGVLEGALGLVLTLAGSAGPRQGFSGTLAVLGFAAVVAGYFTFKLEARMREDQEVTKEGRARTHEAVAFASQRILVVCTLAAVVAWILFHATTATATWVSPRWGVSLDAASAGPVGALVAGFLLAVTGWTMIRLGRTRSGPDEDDKSEETA